MEGKVLVVDDDPTIVDFVAMALSDEGYQVFSAGNGREAMGALETSSPDVILLDISMPVMDGREFFHWLRSDGHSKIPVLVMTAANDARRLCRDMGAEGSLPKPFELDTLFDLVGEFARGTC